MAAPIALTAAANLSTSQSTTPVTLTPGTLTSVTLNSGSLTSVTTEPTSEPMSAACLGEHYKDLEALKDNVNQFFLILCGMIVFLLQCGFAFLEVDAVRSKNATNILIKNMLDVFIACLSYWAIGYMFAYGAGNAFIGYDNAAFFVWNVPPLDIAGWFFQFVFAATAATIVSGAVAERCNFVAYLIYSFVLTGFAYPVVTHWGWTKEGWLVQMGFEDFAGSAIVHVHGGTAAFVGAWLLGPRIGRFDPDTKKPCEIRGHSVPLAALGGFILLFGFLAFNGGSRLSIANPGDGEVVSLVVMNTIVSGTFAAFAGLLINRSGILGSHNWSLLVTLNAALAGMVASCAGADVIYPWAAACTGVLGGINYFIVSKVVLDLLHIDDPLDAVGVHFGGGTVGVVAAHCSRSTKASSTRAARRPSCCWATRWRAPWPSRPGPSPCVSPCSAASASHGSSASPSRWRSTAWTSRSTASRPTPSSHMATATRGSTTLTGTGPWRRWLERSKWWSVSLTTARLTARSMPSPAMTVKPATCEASQM